MTKILHYILLATLLLTSATTAFTQESVMVAWVAARVGDKIIVNFDVENYIDRTMLSDFSKSKLFAEAGKDYDQYKKLKRNYIYENNAAIFKIALKKMVYSEMVKKHALQEFRLNSVSNNSSRGLFGGSRNNNKPQTRTAFNISERHYFDMVQETESRMLKKFLDKRLGIVKARDLFGNDLRKGNFPNKLTESNTDVYFRWYRAMKNRLKQEMFDKEVKKWEAIQAIKGNKDLYIRPVAVHDFHKSTSAFLSTNVLDKDMTAKEWTEILSTHPELSIMMENTKILSLGGASLGNIYREDQTKFNSLKREIIESFSPQLNNSLVSKILDYENKAQLLSDKYSSAKILWDLHKKYDLKGDDKSLMLSKLYKLAATIKEGQANRVETRKTMAAELPRLINILKSKLVDNNFYLGTENEKRLFPTLVETSMREEAKELIDSTDIYTMRALNMGIWFTKFIASKVSLGSKITIKSDVCAYNTYECQKKITDWLKMMEYNKGLENFRTQTLQDYWRGMFTLNPVGSSTMHGQEAINFVFK